MATIDRSQFGSAIIPGLYAAAINSYTEAPKTRTALSKPIKNEKRAWVEILKNPSLALIPEKVESAAMSEILAYEGFTKRFTATTYAGQMSVSKEMLEDDLYSMAIEQTRQLGKSANETKEVNFYNTCFNNAFATTTTADGEYVFSDSHLYNTAGRGYDNLATSAALSVTTLWLAVNQMRRTKDGGGKNLNVVPMKLIVPIELEQVAREILESTHYPTSDINAINAIRHFNLELVVSHYLTSTTAWFLQASKDNIGVYHWDRINTQFSRDGDFATTDSKFGVRFRTADGVHNGVGFIGNAGGA